MEHEVVNYGMCSAEDTAQLTYVQTGILSGILIKFRCSGFCCDKIAEAVKAIVG